MNVRNALLGLIVAITGFLVVGVSVTELASRSIEFSVLLGLPAGLIGGIVLGAVTYRWLGSDDAGTRRLGTALSVFSIVFLAVLLLSVILADLPNSQALPLASVVGLVVAIVLHLWFRYSDREVVPLD